MSVLIFYKSASEHARDVTDFLHEFEQRTTKVIKEVDPESRQGIELCRLYDVFDYPTLVAVGEDGQMRNKWRGLPLPMINEISFYV